MTRRPPRSTLVPDTTLFRSQPARDRAVLEAPPRLAVAAVVEAEESPPDARRPGIERLRLGRPHVGAEAASSEEHTSELQSRQSLVCRLLLENTNPQPSSPIL